MKKSLLKIAGAVLAAVFVVASMGCSPSVGSDPVTYIGTKTPSEAKAVGDVVFNDGSATPSSVIAAREVDAATGVKLTQEEKDAAIAIIFYKGTECSDDTPATERTLGIGLVVDLGKNWCDADAETGELGIKGTSSYCTTDGGSTWGYKFIDKLNGSDNYETVLNNLTDKSTITKFTALCFAHNYSSNTTNLKGPYTSGWFLPSIAELYKFGKYFDQNDLSIVVKDFFVDYKYFWSSSTSSDKIECGFMDKGRSGTAIHNRQKDGVYTCAIREF